MNDGRGIIFEYGALASEPTPYPLFTALAKDLTIRLYTLFDVTPDPIFPEAKQYTFDHLASDAFKPPIDSQFSFTEIVEAHRYMESNAQVGKIASSPLETQEEISNIEGQRLCVDPLWRSLR